MHLTSVSTISFAWCSSLRHWSKLHASGLEGVDEWLCPAYSKWPNVFLQLHQKVVSNYPLFQAMWSALRVFFKLHRSVFCSGVILSSGILSDIFQDSQCESWKRTGYFALSFLGFFSPQYVKLNVLFSISCYTTAQCEHSTLCGLFFFFLKKKIPSHQSNTIARIWKYTGGHWISLKYVRVGKILSWKVFSKLWHHITYIDIERWGELLGCSDRIG